MKNKLIALALSALPILFSIPAHAAVNSCDSNSVHCAYTSSSDTTGKYVRLTWPQANLSGIVCLPLNANLSVNNEALLRLNVQSGKQDWVVAQCADKNCGKSIRIIDDAFTLTEKFDGTFTASPATQAFDLNPGYGEKCNVTESGKLF